MEHLFRNNSEKKEDWKIFSIKMYSQDYWCWESEKLIYTEMSHLINWCVILNPKFLSLLGVQIGKLQLETIFRFNRCFCASKSD